MSETILKMTITTLMKRYIAGVSAVFISSMVIVSSVYADEKAIDLLNKMNQAVHKLNYSGTLVYLKGNSLSSLYIDHTVINGVESERVVRLNKEGNEISRELQDFSLAAAHTIRPEMEKVYSFDLGRENRIANIPCRIITARPKDRNRYLQKYCIDTVTGMLLDYILVGKSHQPVEQFMFTSIDIRLPENTSTSALPFVDQKDCSSSNCAGQSNVVEDAIGTAKADRTVAATNMKTTVVASGAVKNPRQIITADLDDGWVMEALPEGFEISQAPSMRISQTGEENFEVPETKHYIISDGLSSLSVFVSPFTDEADIGAVKINSGALNVVSQRKGDAIITVVGEVPEDTLRNIFNNLRKK